MSSKFYPKFTIATAYPMMFSSGDLKHIESDMLQVIFSESNSAARNLSEPSSSYFFDTIETPTELYRWVQNTESQRLHQLRQLERLWQIEPEDFSKRG